MVITGYCKGCEECIHELHFAGTTEMYCFWFIPVCPSVCLRSSFRNIYLRKLLFSVQLGNVNISAGIVSGI